MAATTRLAIRARASRDRAGRCPDGHDPSIPTRTPPDRGPDVPPAMGRSSGPGPGPDHRHRALEAVCEAARRISCRCPPRPSAPRGVASSNFGRPRTLGRDDERRLLDGLVGRRDRSRTSGAVVDAGAQPFERVAVAKDVEVDPHGLRLVEALRVSRSPSGQGRILAPGVTGHDVVDARSRASPVRRRCPRNRPASVREPVEMVPHAGRRGSGRQGSEQQESSAVGHPARLSPVVPAGGASARRRSGPARVSVRGRGAWRPAGGPWCPGAAAGRGCRLRRCGGSRRCGRGGPARRWRGDPGSGAGPPGAVCAGAHGGVCPAALAPARRGAPSRRCRRRGRVLAERRPDAADAARSRAANRPSPAAVRAAVRPRRRRDAADPRAGAPRTRAARSRRAAARCRAATAAAPGPAGAATGRCIATSRSRSWRHGSSGVSTTLPPVAVRSAARNGSFAPSRRYSAAVGATSPTVRPERRRPGRVWVTRTAYAPGSISPSGASYTPGATWTSVDVRRLEVRPDDDRASSRRSRAASRRSRRFSTCSVSCRRRCRTPPRCRRSPRPGTSSDTSWLKNREKPSQPTQSFAQRPVESDVQATDRPRPYCHWARSGSSRAVTSTVCAAGLAVVPL